jgi:hypothetical protein
MRLGEEEMGNCMVLALNMSIRTGIGGCLAE